MDPSRSVSIRVILDGAHSLESRPSRKAGAPERLDTTSANPEMNTFSTGLDKQLPCQTDRNFSLSETDYVYEKREMRTAGSYKA